MPFLYKYRPTPTPIHTTEPTLATSPPQDCALSPFTIFRERRVRANKIKTFAAISSPPYRDVEPPATKSECCRRRSLKQNETKRWAETWSEQSTHATSPSSQIDIRLSPHESHPTPTPHTCLHSPNLLISLTRNMRAEGEVLSRTTLHRHPFAHSVLNLLSLPHQPPSDGSKTPLPLPKLSPILPLVHPRSSCRWPAHPVIPMVCVFQRRPVRFVSRVFSRFEHRRALTLEGFQLEVSRMGMELPSYSG